LAAGGVAQADPVGAIHLPPGFRAELVYSAPLDLQGSWIALAVDDRGRIFASDQNGGLYRVIPSPIGATPDRTRVEPVPVAVGMAHGMVFHNGALYVVMNGQLGSFTSGLYRLSDSNRDDRFDRIEQLRVLGGIGEHGPHAVVPSPDGKSLYVCCGNATQLPLLRRSLVPQVWAEDQLLPRLYGPADAPGINAPGGWIARMDLDGNNLEIVSVGYRNMFDLAFTADGELLTFDSDTEGHLGVSWYRPPRLCHVAPGSDFGWRGGDGVWPSDYPETLPAVLDSGPSSPTGMVFGAGTKFPPDYQQALFVGDWSYGNIYVCRLRPRGASYGGQIERFASAMPLAVTDLVVRPQDGAIYFVVGGRKSESGLYRIVWEGAAKEAAAQAAAPAPASAVAEAPPTAEELAGAEAARKVRRQLEALLGRATPGAVEQVWPHLSSPDRFIRHAARAALEHQPLTQWRSRALAEQQSTARLMALTALVRVGSPADQADVVKAIVQIPFTQLDAAQRRALVRVAELTLLRLGKPTPATRQQLLAAFDASFPTGDREVDEELAKLLAALRAPRLIDRLLPLLAKSVTHEEGIDCAVVLSAIRGGWSREQRIELLKWFQQAGKSSGGVAFGYLSATRERLLAAMPAAQRQSLGSLASRPLVAVAPKFVAASRPFVQEWTVDELGKRLETMARKPDFDAGRRLFSEAGCYNCHRVAGEGALVGPDLTGLGGRFGLRDVLRAIVEPNHEISDQYRQTTFLVDGKAYVGRLTNISEDGLVVNTDMLDPEKTVTLRRSDIDDQSPSDVSIMPSGLLNTLTAEEVADLTAYLRAGGRRDHALYEAAVAR
jgi:putative heme-binding domain-containing protein